MNQPVARYKAARPDHGRLPGVPREAPPRLGNEEAPGGDVPWSQFFLPVSVEPAGGHIGQVQRGRTGTPNAPRPQGESAELRQVVPGRGANVIGKTGGQE